MIRGQRWTIVATAALSTALLDAPALARRESMMSQALSSPVAAGESTPLQATSLFAIAPIEPRKFQQHDLVQIIVREASKSTSKEKMDNKHDWSAGGELTALPLDGLNTGLPAEYAIQTSKKFKGDGKFDRTDEVTARVTAEVIEILPNGHLVLEARSLVTTNNESTLIRLTGICRPDDVSAANTILSNQIHDLKLVKTHDGELRENGQRGILAKILDTIFAF
ncbi:MAG: flagellar basal body L-ring protein FlgH [Phycisphaerales bacterium]|nr:flagellar basal body L-ring protein FlgH [Phycisphaerales bacterium]